MHSTRPACLANTRPAGLLASPEGRRRRGDPDAEDVAGLAIEFGADYNHCGPLRWSPVVVEIFMTSWPARKAAREPAFFTRWTPAFDLTDGIEVERCMQRYDDGLAAYLITRRRDLSRLRGPEHGWVGGRPLAVTPVLAQRPSGASGRR